MSLSAFVPALVFGLSGLTALAVLLVAGQRMAHAWGRLRRALEPEGSRLPADPVPMRDPAFSTAPPRLFPVNERLLRLRSAEVPRALPAAA